jgi:hypothetical protein
VAEAQWQTQNIIVTNGWTAVFLHVDASYQTLDQLVGADPNNPISEVWLWQPPSGTAQFVTSPASPNTSTPPWVNWGRIALGGNNSLNALIPNAAYLIHSVGLSNYTWRIRGKPVAPDYIGNWDTSGLNLFGFPTVPTSPPVFDAFLALGTNLPATSASEIDQYQGGDLSPVNPTRIFAYHTTPVTRGKAYWMRSTTSTLANYYFGPFQVVLSGSASDGVAFGESGGQYTLRLRNPTPTNVTVTVRLLASETPPVGQPSIGGIPALLVRGVLNNTNLTYGFSGLPLGGAQSWTLAPAGQDGSSIQVVFGLNRYAMTNSPGALLASILQFTDSFGFTEVDVPVSATMASTTGLWLGNASVSQVRNYLKLYQRDANNNPVVSSNGNYVISSVNTNFGAVASAYPLRLIVHNDGTNAYLLQRIYYGLDRYTNLIVANLESALDPNQLGSARRISAVHLPWSPTNSPLQFTGQFTQGGILTTVADLAYDDQVSNPFLHTYHPDHDNLDVTFKTQLAQGYESYRVTRNITLNISPPGSDFNSLTGAGSTVSGSYLETIIVAGLGGGTRSFDVSGTFALSRISSIPVLTRQ